MKPCDGKVDTLGLIADMVAVSGSLREALSLTMEEVRRKPCFPDLPEDHLCKRVEWIWALKVDAMHPRSSNRRAQVSAA